MEYKNNHVLYCEHSNFIEILGDITILICNTVNHVTPAQALGAQKMRSVWAVLVRSNDARETLSQTGITINSVHITMHVDNPHGTGSRIEGERIVIKDFPLWEPDQKITEFFRNHPHIDEFSKIHRSTARNSKFFNGDRFFFSKPTDHPALPNRIQIGEYPCRVVYPNINSVCDRCTQRGHRTQNTFMCEAYEPDQDDIHFFRDGILSNFSETELTYQNIKFPTAEHAYQWAACVEALRDDLAEEVIQAASPHVAKKIANVLKTPDSEWHHQKYNVMEKVLIAKAEASAEFRAALLQTDDKLLVEARPDEWWGSGLSYSLTLTTKPVFYPGNCWLGEILMNLRAELRDPIQSADLHNEQPETARSDTPEVVTTSTPTSSQPAQSSKAVSNVDISEHPVEQEVSLPEGPTEPEVPTNDTGADMNKPARPELSSDTPTLVFKPSGMRIRAAICSDSSFGRAPSSKRGSAKGEGSSPG